jgi:hypothetical protein
MSAMFMEVSRGAMSSHLMETSGSLREIAAYLYNL